MGAQFELFKDEADKWRWRLRHDNGKIIASSGENFERRAGAENGIESVKENAPGAPIVEVDE